MSKIEFIFKKSFEWFQISLPSHDVALKRRGKIVEQGWAIWYLFGTDQHGEYLDYYAAHPMTTDRHVRIYANGTTKNLPVLCSSYLLAPGHTVEHERFIRKENAAKNKKILAALEKKGFGLTGDEPYGVAINRHLMLDS